MKIKLLKKKIVIIVFSILIPAIGLISICQNTYATASTYNADVVKKALLTGVQYCYSNGAIQETVDAISGFSNFSTLIIGGTDSNFVALPTGLTNIYDNGVSCEQLFMGYSAAFNAGGSFEGVFDIFGKNPRATSKEAKTALLEGMGYKMVENEENASQKCISFKYNEKTGTQNPKEVETDQVCAEIEDNKITSLSTNKSTATYYGANMTSYAPPALLAVTEDGKIELLRARTERREHGYVIGTTKYITTAGVGSTWDEFVTNLRQTLSSAGDGNGSFSYTHSVYNARVNLSYEYVRSADESESNVNESDIGDIGFEMVYSGSEALLRTTSGRATKYLSNGVYPYWYSLEFSDAEKIQLLALSLQNWFFEGVDVNDYWACDVSNWADYGSFTTKINITASLEQPSSECRLNTGKATKSDSSINSFTTISGRSMFDASGATKLTLQETIDEINRLVGELPEDEDLTPEVTPDMGGTEDAGTTTAPCYQSAGALGWIICPVIKGVGAAVSGLYDYIAQGFLELDSSLFEDGGSTYQGWQYFQGFANIIFAIFFIIVILSQVTGIGLSNYGIKKILPRLIIVAILVNISFIVCQLAIDISNILGYSLENLLAGIPIAGSTPFSFGSVVTSIISTLLTGAGLTLGGAALVVTWELWLLPFLLTLLVAIISVIFFFIILGVRKAGVIILVVLAPIAIICYALPNTKKIFDRWLKMFTSLLLVFPICGLLMGGGQFASNLLIKAGGGGEGFFYYLVAMLLTVVPFFFIPALLKGSMAAMGALGAKISGFGSKLSHGATGAIRRSDRVQDWNKRLRVNTQYRRAQRTMARAEKNGRSLSASQARRISLAKAAYEKQRLDDAANRHYAGRSADQIDAAIAAQDIKFRQQQVDEEASRIMTGGVSFTDSTNTARAINANDVSDLTLAYDQAIARSLDASNSAEVRAAATLQAKALQKLLMGKGDTGRSRMLKTLRGHTYSALGNRDQEDAVKQLYDHLASDDKWMASIKGADIGSYNLVNDAASADPGLSKVKAAAEYNVMGSNKFTPETIGQAGDSFFDNIEQAISDGNFATGSGNESKLQAFDRIMTQALSNPETAKGIKDERLNAMNAVRQAAYEARMGDYVRATMSSNPTMTQTQAEAEFKSKYGEFQYMRPNDELKVPHPKATMPSGWRRATVADTLGRAIPAGLKEGDWVQTGAGGNIIRLSADEVKRAEAIEQQNIQADINNSLKP